MNHYEVLYKHAGKSEQYPVSMVGEMRQENSRLSFQ